MPKRKKNNITNTTVVPEMAAVVPVSNAPAKVPVMPVTERLEEIDRMALELAKQKRANAQIQNENAELSFRYTVLQIYRKYGLSDKDHLSENGEIVRNPQ